MEDKGCSSDMWRSHNVLSIGFKWICCFVCSISRWSNEGGNCLKNAITLSYRKTGVLNNFMLFDILENFFKGFWIERNYFIIPETAW